MFPLSCAAAALAACSRPSTASLRTLLQGAFFGWPVLGLFVGEKLHECCVLGLAMGLGEALLEESQVLIVNVGLHSVLLSGGRLVGAEGEAATQSTWTV